MMPVCIRAPKNAMTSSGPFLIPDSGWWPGRFQVMSEAKTSVLSVAMSPLPKQSYIFATTAIAGWAGASVATGFPPFMVG